MTYRVHFNNGDIRDIEGVFQVKNGDIYYDDGGAIQIIRDSEYTNAYRIDNVPKAGKAMEQEDDSQMQFAEFMARLGGRTLGVELNEEKNGESR